jgi:hypothetical protein
VVKVTHLLLIPDMDIIGNDIRDGNDRRPTPTLAFLIPILRA